MRKLLVFAICVISIFLTACPVTTEAQTTATVSGRLLDEQGNGAPNSYLQVDLFGCGNNKAQVSGGVVVYSKPYPADTSGNIIAANIYRNDAITCNSQTSVTQYYMQAYVNGKPQGPRLPYVVGPANISAGIFNWNTATPSTTGPVVLSPTGDLTYQRLDGANHQTGTWTPSLDDAVDYGSIGARIKSAYFGTGGISTAGSVTITGSSQSFGISADGGMALSTAALTGRSTGDFTLSAGAHQNLIVKSGGGFSGSPGSVTIDPAHIGGTIGILHLQYNDADVLATVAGGVTVTGDLAATTLHSSGLTTVNSLTVSTGTVNGNIVVGGSIVAGGSVLLPFGSVLCLNTGGCDTAASRFSAGVVGISTGAAAGADGSLRLANLTASGAVSGATYATATNCSGVGTAANPSVVTCAAAAAGSFSCDPAATGGTCTVNTTAVTANSQIFVIEDETLGARLGVTCNTGTTVIPTSRLINARVAATSFTIKLGTVTTNPGCFSYFIVN